MRWVITQLNPPSRLRRWTVKALLLAVTTLLVLYPNLFLLPRNVAHWRSLDALIDPASRSLDPLVADVMTRLSDDPSDSDVLRAVEGTVNEHIPYEWDWVTWGVVDYVPTVEETIRAGREDCDGRAVVAASVLAQLGYESRIVADFSHVWVWTPCGQAMSPVGTDEVHRLVISDEEGTRVNTDALLSRTSILRTVPANIGYGIAVFPVWRELVLTAVVWLVLLHARARIVRIVLSVLLITAGWFVLRRTCADPWHPSVGGAWVGISLAVCGFGLAAWPQRLLGPTPARRSVRSPDATARVERTNGQ